MRRLLPMVVVLPGLLGSRILPPDAPRGTVLTPYGTVSGPTAYRVCRAEHVFVGTVVNREQYKRPVPDEPYEVVDLTLEVERVVHGDPARYYPITISAPWTSVDDGFEISEPRGALGNRYAVAATVLKVDAGPHLEAGRTMLVQAHPLDAKAELPPATTLADQLDEVCAMNGLLRYSHYAAGLGGQGRPTTD